MRCVATTQQHTKGERRTADDTDTYHIGDAKQEETEGALNTRCKMRCNHGQRPHAARQRQWWRIANVMDNATEPSAHGRKEAVQPETHADKGRPLAFERHGYQRRGKGASSFRQSAESQKHIAGAK